MISKPSKERRKWQVIRPSFISLMLLGSNLNPLRRLKISNFNCQITTSETSYIFTKTFTDLEVNSDEPDHKH